MSGDRTGTSPSTLLEEVRLERYGALTDTSVVLGPGVTVVTGPNEAGKSTLLAALGDLLWGLPLKNPRYALTSRSSVRVGATLGDGNDVLRTNRGLMAADGLTELLPPWGADGRAAWDDGFGLDHARLREGGAQVFAGGGDLARLVFTARSGFTGGAVLDALDARAEALYRKHRGAKAVAVRAALSTVDAVRAELVGATTRASSVVAAEREVDEAETALRRAVDAERDADRARSTAVLASASAEDAAALRGIRRERDTALAGGSVLAAPALEAFDAASDAQEIALAQSAALEDLSARWRDDLAGLRTAPGLLTDAAAVEALHAQAQAREADAVRAGDLAGQAAVQNAASDVAAGQVSGSGSGPVSVDLAAQIDAAAAEHPALARALADATTRMVAARDALAVLEADGDLPDIGALAPLVAAVAARTGDASPAKRWRASAAAADAAARECEEHLRGADALDVAGAVAAARRSPGAAVPAADAVDPAVAALESARSAEAEARRASERSGADLVVARETVEAARAPAVDRDVVEALRASRDSVLEEILGDGDRLLTPDDRARYAAAVVAADDGSDALVGAADQLARAEAAARGLEVAAAEQERADEALERAEQVRREAEDSFAALWAGAGVRVPSPARADVVRRALVAAARSGAQVREHCAAAARDAVEIAAGARELARLLASTGAEEDAAAEGIDGSAAEDAGAQDAATLESLLEQARAVVVAADDAREARAARTRAAADVSAARTGHQRAEQALAAWGERWSSLLTAAALPVALDVTGWAVRMQVLARADEARERALTTETAARAARAAWDGFADQVAGAARRHGEAASWSDDEPHEAAVPDVALDRLDRLDPVGPAEQQAVAAVVAALWQRLEDARADAATLAEREEQLSQAGERLETLDGEERAAAAAMAAALGDPDTGPGADPETVGGDALEDLLIRSRTVSGLSTREHELLERLETRTLAGGGGVGDVESLVASLAEVDAVTLESRLARAVDDEEVARIDRSTVAEALGAARNRLEQLKSGSDAAEVKARESEAVTDLARVTERYALTHLQRTVLREQLEEHSARHANPLLEDAGRLLETLTAGRWVALSATAASASGRTLRVVDSGGAPHEPAQLSEGTADQVFLALRLAGITQVAAERAEQGLPALPVVLDDALMTFDDARATAALRLLAGCGQQAIVLSHHQHLADLATGLGSDAVHVARLDRPGSGAEPEHAATVRAAAARGGPVERG